MYYLTIAIVVGIYVILALGLNIITGYAGQVSLGHAAFYGIGAYTSAVLTTAYGFSFVTGLVVAAVVTALIGAFVGLTSLRVRHDFLAITTMGINFVVVAIFLYVPFFGGALGIGGVPDPSFFGRRITKPEFVVVVGAVVAFAIIVDRVLLRSWMGLALEGIREDEEAAQAVGVDVSAYKVVAFSIGTALAGMAGSLYAHFIGSVNANDFGFPTSITILCMVVFGGMGTLRGAIVGALVLGVAPELFRPLRDYRLLMYGALLVAMMRFQPAGLLGREGFLYRRFKMVPVKVG